MFSPSAYAAVALIVKMRVSACTQLPTGQTPADALSSSRYHLLAAVQSGSRGSIEALIDEVAGPPREWVRGCCAFVILAVFAVIGVVLLTNRSSRGKGGPGPHGQ